MNENEQFADAAILRAVELQSVATWLLADWLRQLETLQRDLVSLIAANDPTDGGNLDTLIAVVTAKIKAVFDELNSRFEDAFDQIAEIQAEHERNLFLLIFGITLGVFSILRASEIEIMGVKPAEWLRRTAGTLTLSTTSAIRRGVTAGDNLGALIDRVKGKSELAGEIETPLIKPAKASVESLTRTAVEAVAERTREEAAKAILPVVEVNPPEVEATAPPKVIRYGWQQISVLDGRTTQICRSYAFKIWDAKFTPIGHALPFNGGVPRHVYCRSSIVLILLDSDPVKLQTFVDFMARQSEETKKRVFGSKTYALWLAKKITDSDLIRSREKQLSLDALRKRK